MRNIAKDYKYSNSEANWGKVETRLGARGLQGITWGVGLQQLGQDLSH
jgi:hypothetical protein